MICLEKKIQMSWCSSLKNLTDRILRFSLSSWFFLKINLLCNSEQRFLIYKTSLVLNLVRDTFTSKSKHPPSSIDPTGFWSWAAAPRSLTPASHPATPSLSEHGADPSHWGLNQVRMSVSGLVGDHSFDYLQGNTILTSRGSVGGTAKCTVILHVGQKIQVQLFPLDLITVLLCSLLLLWAKVPQAPALSYATGQIHQGLRHLPRPQMLIWTVKPEGKFQRSWLFNFAKHDA